MVSVFHDPKSGHVYWQGDWLEYDFNRAKLNKVLTVFARDLRLLPKNLIFIKTMLVQYLGRKGQEAVVVI